MVGKSWFDLRSTALMLRELTKVEFWSLYKGQKGGQEAAVLDQGIVIIGTRILEGEAEVEVEVEVGEGMSVISTVEETEITVIGAEAAALITTEVVGEVNMMRTGAAEVGLMEEVPPLLAVAPVLEGALLHEEQLLPGMLVQMDVITRTGLQLQRVYHLGVDVLVLAAPCHVLMLMIEEQGRSHSCNLALVDAAYQDIPK